MLKFRCQHCGQRIAVPKRHLGKLVTCAECGQATHPLAEQIVKAKSNSGPAPAPGPAETVCGNCARPIGRLQASHEWQSQRVCGPCYRVLSSESDRPMRALATVVARVPPQDSPYLPPPHLTLRERLVRAAMVFFVAVVALYGALTLLRDIAGLIAVAAVAVLALLALYALFRARLASRAKPDSPKYPGAAAPARTLPSPLAG
jgi:hypothetical protein